MNSAGTMAPGVVKKKLVIKPLKPLKRHVGEGNYKEEVWKELLQAIKAIQTEQPVSQSLEQLYRYVEDLCIESHSDWLYQKLEIECEGHAGRALSSLKEWLYLQADMFLEHVGKVWEHYCSQLILIRQIFLYLDRTYLLMKSEHRSVFDMGLSFFRSQLTREFAGVEQQTVEGILMVIDADRNGDSIDRDLVKTLVRMFSLLGLYESSFTPAFLKRVESFYTEEARQYIGQMPLGQYLLYVEKRLRGEDTLCSECLEPTTRNLLIHKVEECIILPHVGYMLENGLVSLLDEDKMEDLRRMYEILGLVSAHKDLCSAFKSYLKKVGGDVVGNADKDTEMISFIIHLKSRMDKIVAECFSNDIIFQDALKDAFSHFINQRGNRPAELLAKYMDSILKSGAKGAGSSGKGKGAEEEVESALEASLSIFRFIQGKDAFEAFYKKDLAKRLLFNRSASIDAEKSAISKLKAECGTHYTSKMEGMFKDVEVSKDVVGSFKSSATAKEALAQACPGIDVQVQILTSGLWPTYPITQCNFPENVGNALEIFKEHYLEKHSGRKLVWLHSLGTCIMKVQFDCGTKELALSFFQAAVLMAFQDCDKLSFKHILEATGLEKEELKRTLQSLACGRERVLTKEPKGKDVEESDEFEFNSKYTSRLYRVRINAIQMKETVDESKKTNEAVMQDRQHQIDAAIVRIMKTRKTLGHKLLVNELVSQLRFPVVAADLKRRIESLIDREYIERDENDAQVYNYLA